MPKLNKHLRKQVLKMVNTSVDKNGSINPALVKKFTKSLKELSLSQSILALTEYSKGLKRQINKTTLVVESVMDIPSSTQKQIIKTLSASSTFKILHSTFKKDPSLLGGVRIKIGDTLIDDSLQARANQLRERIING